MSERKYLRNISSKTWEHPADKAALNALRKIPHVGTILQKLVGATEERALRLFALSSAVRVNNNQFPKIHNLLKEACNVLDYPSPPELYICEDPFMNAGAIGVNKPFIILNSSLVEKLNEEQMLDVIGHELGHCMSGHALYNTLLFLIINVSSFIVNLVPISEIIFQAIKLALLEWYRKSELSADRAGALVLQKPDVSYSVLMRMAGGTKIGEMNMDEFFKQADEYDKGGNILDSVYKLSNLLEQTHPFPVIRLRELKTWVDEGHYDKIISGEYVSVLDEDKTNIEDDFKEAAESYKKEIGNSGDPLAQAVSKISQDFEKFGKDVEKFFKNLFE